MKVSELEIELNKMDFKGEIQLDECTLVTEPKKFIKSHVQALKSNPKNKTYYPYWVRLIKLYNIGRKQ